MATALELAGPTGLAGPTARAGPAAPPGPGTPPGRAGAGALRRASDLAGAGGVDQLVPVAPELHPLLPGGGLLRGSTVAVTPGTSSLMLALLAGASAAGAWSAVVGMPGLGALAAAQAGIALERLALVPDPGPEWTAVVAALLDGVDVVVAAPPGPVSGRVASRLAARARQRGSVLLPYGRWEGATLTLTAEPGIWEGLDAGRGRLRCRELTITARGRGAAGRPRWVRVRLPGPAGRLTAIPPAAGRGRTGVVPPVPHPGPPLVGRPAGGTSRAGPRRLALTVVGSAAA